ncbi:DUF3011 domain-containing protein [Pseudoxanthomonas broegbernensis]|uniref:DUF3011 domain-containing protein n=1 Tax=Pseudoxanthomonas broegbernensis TaxID=83619 RepID=UPI001832C00D|nr:hypothetical protein [Pseudoxanthomonas broegbernensis]
MSTACLALGLALFAAPSAPAAAQPARAHAPENLRALPAPERARAIEREYAEQSRGRRIPDDQLEFYLDRAGSGWGMSRIRQDISASLRGNGGGHRPGAGQGGWNGSNWNGQTLVCSSEDRRRRECRTPFGGRPVLVENISDTRCVEGVNFGGGGGTMWVDRGCRGRFAQGRGGTSEARTVRCESQDNRDRTCPAGFGNPAVLVRQLSKAACIQGRTWGQRGSSIWVSGGCRGEFAEDRRGGGRGDSGYTLVCSSEDNRARTCTWERRRGRPVLVEQISKTRCQEGRNWGWDGNGTIWVNGGCRARFGAR